MDDAAAAGVARNDHCSQPCHAACHWLIPQWHWPAPHNWTSTERGWGHIVQSMATGSEQLAGTVAGRPSAPSTIVVGLAAFAAVQLGLALFMAVSPHGFYTDVGPFGAFNGHYVRDVATFYAAIGVGLLLAIRHVAWRVPVLAITTIQYALHSVNHLLDIDKAHPAWNGYFDFGSIGAATVLLAWLWRRAALEVRA
jgi:hypothetical protein